MSPSNYLGGMKLSSFLTALLLAFSFVVVAQTPVRVPMPLREVTVYRRDAELSHRTEHTFPIGITDVRLTGLSSGIQQKGMQIEVQGADLLATSLVKVAPRMTATDSLEAARKELRRLEAEREATTTEKEFLLHNKSLPVGEKEVYTVELQKGADYFHKRIFDLSVKLSELSDAITAQQVEVKRLQDRSNTRTASSQFEVALRLNLKRAGAVRLVISYVVAGSSWEPRHEIRLRDPGQPIEVVNRALVYNRSGLDWAGVKVTLLSANPNVGSLRPGLDPWELRTAANRFEEGRLDNYAVKGTKPGQNQSPADDAPTEGDDFTERFGVATDVTVVAGSTYLVPLGSATVAAEYEYLTVPKVDPGAFLVAKVADWEKLKLMADSAAVYLQNAYVGQTLLNASAYGDTLELSLGRDPLVKVTRSKRYDYSSKNLLGRRKVTLRYEIVAKNLHRSSINLRVLDQVPISQEEDIDVETLDLGGATLDKASGKLTWKMPLAANESRKLPFAFSIEYPQRKRGFLFMRAKTKSPKFR